MVRRGELNSVPETQLPELYYNEKKKDWINARNELERSKEKLNAATNDVVRLRLEMSKSGFWNRKKKQEKQLKSLEEEKKKLQSLHNRLYRRVDEAKNAMIAARNVFAPNMYPEGFEGFSGYGINC